MRNGEGVKEREICSRERGRKNRIPTITVGEKEKKSEGMIVR